MRPGRDANPSLLLVPWTRKRRATPLLPLWAVRPVQSLSACTRAHSIYFYLTAEGPLRVGNALLSRPLHEMSQENEGTLYRTSVGKFDDNAEMYRDVRIVMYLAPVLWKPNMSTSKTHNNNNNLFNKNQTGVYTTYPFCSQNLRIHQTVVHS